MRNDKVRRTDKDRKLITRDFTLHFYLSDRAGDPLAERDLLRDTERDFDPAGLPEPDRDLERDTDLDLDRDGDREPDRDL